MMFCIKMLEEVFFMCTAITLQTANGENFFGRNMDFSYDIESHLLIVPRNYEYESISGKKLVNKYSFIGIGQELEGITAFFDGVNEKGFAAAALYFAGYAQYDNCNSNSFEKIAAFDIVNYLLGKCSTINDVAYYLKQACIIAVEDPVTHTVAPLHWFATDKSGESIVIEQTSQGLYIYRNNVGVLANSPDFAWQVTNLKNYTSVSPRQDEQVQWGKIQLNPFGQGGGTSLLPGGYTSPERFVRTAYLRNHIPTPKDRTEAVCACFNIMNSTNVAKGAVITSRETFDYTRYTAFCSTDNQQYFFRTYDNLQIRTAKLCDEYKNSSTITDLGNISSDMIFPDIGYCNGENK